MQSTITVPTVYHIIKDGNTGNDAADAVASVNALSAAFEPEFTFNLVATTVTDNSGWFNNVGNEMTMKNALRQGGCDTLNIYSTSGYGYLGFAYFPTVCAYDQNRDGVVIHYGSVPGGILGSYNEGDTLTHEVGHWLGLYHTFENGCNGSGDGIADTPPHTVNYNCVQSDTCSGGGLDPIENYMNYTPDSCMYEFSRGQIDRMIAQWEQYREGDSTPINPPTPNPPTPGPPTPNPPTPNPPTPTYYYDDYDDYDDDYDYYDDDFSCTDEEKFLDKTRMKG